MRHVVAFGVVFLCWQSACAGDDPPPPNCGTEGKQAATGFTFHVIRPLAKHIATGHAVSSLSQLPKPSGWVPHQVTAQGQFVLGESWAGDDSWGVAAEKEPISWTPGTGTVSLGRPAGMDKMAKFYPGDVNAHGTVAIGKWDPPDNSSQAEVAGANLPFCRWTATAGFEETFAPWQIDDFGRMSLSAEGSTAVIEALTSGLTRAFVWQEGQVYDVGLPGFSAIKDRVRAP